MSTRAIYTFVESGTDQVFHVYKHHDGYPEWALRFIARTFTHGIPGAAWDLPRFEPDEAGAAFIATNKDGPGGVRLLHSGRWHDVAPGDIEYRYLISKPVGNLPVGVEAYAVSQDWPSGKWNQLKIGGTLLSTLVKMDDAALDALAASMDERASKGKLKPVGV